MNRSKEHNEISEKAGEVLAKTRYRVSCEDDRAEPVTLGLNTKQMKL